MSLLRDLSQVPHRKVPQSRSKSGMRDHPTTPLLGG